MTGRHKANLEVGGDQCNAGVRGLTWPILCSSGLGPRSLEFGIGFSASSWLSQPGLDALGCQAQGGIKIALVAIYIRTNT